MGNIPEITDKEIINSQLDKELRLFTEEEFSAVLKKTQNKLKAGRYQARTKLLLEGRAI